MDSLVINLGYFILMIFVVIPIGTILHLIIWTYWLIFPNHKPNHDDILECISFNIWKSYSKIIDEIATYKEVNNPLGESIIYVSSSTMIDELVEDGTLEKRVAEKIIDETSGKKIKVSEYKKLTSGNKRESKRKIRKRTTLKDLIHQLNF